MQTPTDRETFPYPELRLRVASESSSRPSVVAFDIHDRADAQWCKASHIERAALFVVCSTKIYVIEHCNDLRLESYRFGRAPPIHVRRKKQAVSGESPQSTASAAAPIRAAV